MDLSNHERLELEHLEESLWRASTRFNKDYMEELLTPDFFEFGRSGKTYTRTECLETPPQEINAKFPLEKFMVHYVGDNTVLIIYISEVADETIQRANRSSLWIKINKAWKLRFHQGTPLWQ